MIGWGHLTKTQRPIIHYSQNGIPLRSNSGGYTITEVLVFLGISAVIFFILAGTFTSHQRRAEFTTAAREVESKLRDMTNDITTGYYSNSGDFSCKLDVVNNIPEIATSTTEQGKNEDCILLGTTFYKVDDNTYKFNTVAGLRKDTTTGKDVRDYKEAKPIVIDSTGMTQEFDLLAGVTIESIKIGSGSGNLNGFGFFSSLSGIETSSSSPTSNLIFFKKNNPSDTVEDQVEKLAGNPPPPSDIAINLSEGVTICLKDSSTNLKAAISIGKSNNRQSTDLEIGADPC